MKEVQPIYDFLTPPAAAQEDITQPMGPLEEGDQALVDAIADFPEGLHQVPHENGKTFMAKENLPGQDVVTVTTMKSNGSRNEVGGLIEKRLGGHTSADIQGQAALQISPDITSVQAFGSEAWANTPHDIGSDRQKVQEIKKVTAQEIKAASEAIRQQS